MLRSLGFLLQVKRSQCEVRRVTRLDQKIRKNPLRGNLGKWTRETGGRKPARRPYLCHQDEKWREPDEGAGGEEGEQGRLQKPRAGRIGRSCWRITRERWRAGLSGDGSYTYAPAVKRVQIQKGQPGSSSLRPGILSQKRWSWGDIELTPPSVLLSLPCLPVEYRDRVTASNLIQLHVVSTTV